MVFWFAGLSIVITGLLNFGTIMGFNMQIQAIVMSSLTGPVSDSMTVHFASDVVQEISQVTVSTTGKLSIPYINPLYASDDKHWAW